jgi:hypothetical protein
MRLPWEIKAAHWYSTELNVGGEKVVIRIVVREHYDGKRYYDHFEAKGAV